MEGGPKGKGIVRFRVWHWHDAKRHKPIREGPKESLARSTKRNFYLGGVPCADSVPAAQLDVKEGGGGGGGVRGEFACVKWHWKDVGWRTDARTASISTFGFLSARFSTFPSLVK